MYAGPIRVRRDRAPHARPASNELQRRRGRAPGRTTSRTCIVRPAADRKQAGRSRSRRPGTSDRSVATTPSRREAALTATAGLSSLDLVYPIRLDSTPRGDFPLADDLDRRPERDAVAQELDVAVVEPDAAVRDRLPEEVRPRRSVHADDPAARPVGELRVRARLERVGAEDRPVGVDRGVELVGDVEEPERRLRARCADGDLVPSGRAARRPRTRTCALRGR